MTLVSALCAIAAGAAFALSQYGPTSGGMLAVMLVAVAAGVVTGVAAVARTRAGSASPAAPAAVLLVNIAIAAATIWWAVEIVSNLD